MSDETRQKLSFDEAVAMLPDGEKIHTFRQGVCLIGADWKRDQILEAIREHGAELSGPLATRMKHGLVIFDPETLFIETK